jgi:hypothetical protein
LYIVRMRLDAESSGRNTETAQSMSICENRLLVEY